MHVANDHTHTHNDHRAMRVNWRPLAIALAITGTFLVIEVIGGLWTNSLALLADAGHMATDVAALGLSLFAVWLARRPATPQRSFGYYRAEVLAALVNSATLVLIALYIFWEAYQRIGEPPEVDSAPMLVVAVGGLIANAASAWVLTRGGGHTHNLNMRGALLHVVGDMLGSIGAIAAALVMLLTGWYLADPLLSAAIGLLILISSWRLLKESVNVLLEATPGHIDAEEVRAAVGAVEGVEDLHDMHIWTVTSGMIAMSGHLELSGTRDWHEVLVEVSCLLQDRFGIAHATLQPEDSPEFAHAFRGCALDAADRNACQISAGGYGHTHSAHGH